MLPTDTITVEKTFFAEGTFTLIDLNTPYTVVGYNIVTDGGNRPNEILRGNSGQPIIAHAHTGATQTNNSGYIEINTVLSEPLVFQHPNNNKAATVTINYVPRDRTTTQDADILATISQDPKLLSTTLMADGNKFQVQRTYTFGDLTTILLLIPIALMIAYKMILFAFRKPVQYHK